MVCMLTLRMACMPEDGVFWQLNLHAGRVTLFSYEISF